MQARPVAPGESGSVGIRSFEKGIHLLQALRRAGGPVRLNEIAAAAGMSPSAARGYLVSLIRTGLARQDPTTGRYDLGEEALHLGLAALRRGDFLRLAQETLADLVGRLRQTALLAVWGESGPVVVAKTEGPETSVYEVRIGTRVTLLGTATGEVFMAHLPRAAWEGLIGPGDGDGNLDGLLRGIREAGLARTRPAKLPERWSMSVPVFDHTGGLRGALTVIAREDARSATLADDTAAALRSAASGLSRRLGHLAS